MWIEGLSKTERARWSKVGLVPASAVAICLLELIDVFLTSSTVKPSTRAAYQQTTKSLIASIGANRPIDSISVALVDKWRSEIGAMGLAQATIAKRTIVARTIFNKAVSLGYIKANPFLTLKVGSQANPKRSMYVTVETIEDVLNACPTAQWRGVVVVARWAGLRCPSEFLELRWSDIDWTSDSMTVRSSKTSRSANGGVRVMPLDPRVKLILRELFEQRAADEERVFSSISSSSANLRTSFHKIIERAGHKPWPRLFQNLRGSCETDWVDRFPSHQVADWMGHSAAIAAKHYLKHKDHYFKLATMPMSASIAVPPLGSGTAAQSFTEPKFQDLIAVLSSLPIDKREQILQLISVSLVA